MNESSAVPLSVVICTKDRASDLALAIGSLLYQTELPDELIVVDAGRSNGIRRRVERQLDGALPLAYTRTSAGLTRQRNIGIGMASGHLILFLDDDVFLAADFVEVVKRVFLRDEQEAIQAVQCTIVDEYPRQSAARARGSRAQTVRSFGQRVMAHAFLLTTQGDGSMKASGFQARAGLGRLAGQVQALSGCACFRRSAFSAIGFDEGLGGFGWMEDVDISRQLKAQGLYAYYEPAAVLLHRNSLAGRDDPVTYGRMMIRNHAFLFRKHTTGRPSETAAFVWSCIGLILLALLCGELRKAYGMLLGAGEALACPLGLDGSGAGIPSPGRR